MSSENAKAISFMGSDNGFAFKDVIGTAGQFRACRLLVSDAIAPDEIMLIDGSGIAASAGTVVFSSSSHGTLRMNTDPENNSALTSMWQRNLQGLLCERWFGCAMIWDTAAAVVDGVDYEQRDGLIMSEHNIEQEGAHSALPPPSPGKSRLTKAKYPH